MHASATAPGKVILFGEHAVVYGQPAIAVPVTDVQASVTVSDKGAPPKGAWLTSHQVGLDAPLHTLGRKHWSNVLIKRVRRALRMNHLPPFRMTVRSDIPVASGMGSGAAVAVAAIRALCAFLKTELPEDRINAIAYQVEKVHHGTPSGIDNTVVTYEKPVFFIRDKPIEILTPGSPVTIVIADTGVASPTSRTVADVRRGSEQDSGNYYRVFDEIGSITRLARRAILAGQPAQLGPLMSSNQRHLEFLGVSSPELNHLVYTAMRNHALGAKLSGGGRGGNLIALPPAGQAESLAAALETAGAVRTFITTFGEPNPDAGS